MVLSVNDLRTTKAVKIPRALSWERTAEDVARELRHNPNVGQLRECRHVVVSLGTVGAVLMSREKGKTEPTFRLFYDPRYLEGDWENNPQWGRMMGYTTTLTAALVFTILANHAGEDWASSRSEPVTDRDLEDGIKLGVNAMRELYRSGYKCDETTCHCKDIKKDFEGYEYIKGYLYQFDYKDDDREEWKHAPALTFPNKGARVVSFQGLGEVVQR